MSSSQCQQGLPIESNLHRQFDVNNNGRLDKSELETMAITLDSKIAINLGPFNLAITKESPQCAVNTFISLRAEARNAFYDKTLSFMREPFMSLLWIYAPQEANRLTTRGKIPIPPQESNQMIIDRISKIPDAQFIFEVPPVQFTAQYFASVTAALEQIKTNTPLILAFAEEVHPDANYHGTTTADIFAKEAIPNLADKYKDLVIEFLPYGMPQNELDYFMKHGVIDEQHTNILKISLELLKDNGESAKKILYACRNHGIKLHGGGPSLIEMGNILTNQPLPNNKSVFEAIRDNSQKALQELADTKQPVLWYGGSAHNQISGKPANASFGKTLAQKYSYVEVDLVIPDILCDHIRRGSNEGNIVVPIKQYARFMNHSNGVNLVTRQPHSFAIIFPK